MAINIGISEDKRVNIAKGLSRVLADTYTLYLKTQKYHWNVTGLNFNAYHDLFEGQYKDLALNIDRIAERIRVLGVKAPGSFNEFSEYATIKEDPTYTTSPNEMVRNLLADHETIARTIREVFPSFEGSYDEGSFGLLTERVEFHERAAWFLRNLTE